MLRYCEVSGGVMSQRLRHDDQPQRQRPMQAERGRRFALAARHRHHAGAHDLGDEAGGIGDEAEHQRGEFRMNLRSAAQIEAGKLREFEADRPAGGEIGDRRQADDQRQRGPRIRRPLAGRRLATTRRDPSATLSAAANASAAPTSQAPSEKIGRGR